ncbi:MAG: ECF transporter S component [Lachnospiraceae bacterium]|nr:ECF transporter S component [Lachnospiraceae bacterium]
MSNVTETGTVSLQAGIADRSRRTKELVLASLFTAIIFIMAFVPNLGYINLILIKATTLFIPVILGAIFLGPKWGAFFGGVFGLTSFMNNTFNPSVLSFAFSPIVAYQMFGPIGILKTIYICFVPRILIGVGAYWVYRGVRKITKGNKIMRTVALAAAGVTGALINTILVMSGIYFLYAEAYAVQNKIAEADVFKTIMGVVFGQGIIEAISAGIIVAVVGSALMLATKSDK